MKVNSIILILLISVISCKKKENDEVKQKKNKIVDSYYSSTVNKKLYEGVKLNKIVLNRDKNNTNYDIKLIFKENPELESILKPYNIAFWIYPKKSDLTLLSDRSKERNRKFDIYNIISPYNKISNSTIFNNFYTKIKNIEKIKVFLFNKDKYKGPVGNIIEIKTINFKNETKTEIISTNFKNFKILKLPNVSTLKNAIPIFPYTPRNFSAFDKLPHDKNGILLLKNTKTAKTPFYYPVSYAVAALTAYSGFINSKDTIKKGYYYSRFINYANFIYNSKVDIKDFSVWHCKYEIKPYKTGENWASAMAQGYIIGVMLQAYSITGDEKFYKTAKRAVNAYKYTIKDGGITSNWDDYTFYEEYADPNSHVLNGNMFSLFGLYYFYINYGDKEAKELFDQGIETLIVKIKEYDAGFTSYYYTLNDLGYSSVIGRDSDHYHELHIFQLLTLYKWTHKEIFKEYAHVFLKYDTGMVNLFLNKQKFKSITASYSIDEKEYGVDKLIDESYGYGKYWSYYKHKTELIIDFGEKKENISDFVFYSPKMEAIPKYFDVYVKQDSKYILLYNDSQLNDYELRTHKTGKFRTFIKKFKLPKKVSGSALKFVFKPINDNVYQLREINIFYDRYKELDIIMNNVNNRILQ